jgi:thiosulfate reductase cytochrome b subunit
MNGGRIAVYRHPLLVRMTHWINVACVLVLLMSGLQILNAHPALDWGSASNFEGPWLQLVATGHGAFPSWAMLPGWQDLAAGRRWHFFFAWVFVLNGSVYLVHTLASGRLRRVLSPTPEQLRHIGRTLREHLRLRFPQGEQARNYNVLQKLTYLFVVLGLLPLMFVTGLTMSPGVDARLHFLTELFAGRQSARTVHFFTAAALLLFVLIHVAAVIAAGVWTEMRSMLTGWFVLVPARRPETETQQGTGNGT